LSENIKNLKRAMIGQIIREVTKGEGSLVEQARIRKLFDSEMKARIERAVDVQRQQMRASCLNDWIGFRSAQEDEQVMDETLAAVSKLVAKGISRRIAPKAFSAISAVASAFKKNGKAKAKFTVSMASKKPVNAKAVHDTSPIRTDRHRFNAAMKNAGGNIHKIKL
jgi:hypothetical protein